MAMKDTKMIRITSRGFVTTSRGKVLSPIISPYRESINRIWSMLTIDRADIEEKLPDGTFVKLNIQNYDKNNSIKVDVASGVPVTSPRPVEVEKPLPVEEKMDETPEVEELDSENDGVEESDSEQPIINQSSSRRNKKRNKNRQNQVSEQKTDNLSVEAEQV